VRLGVNSWEIRGGNSHTKLSKKAGVLSTKKNGVKKVFYTELTIKRIYSFS